MDRFVHAPPTAETVQRFVDELGRQRRITPEQARLWKTAVRRMNGVRGETEPDDADWFAAHLDELMTRILNEDRDKPTQMGTAKTYRSRASAALNEFRAMRRNPVAYANRGAVADADRNAELRGRVLTCHLGHGRIFRYVLPANGLNRKDIERIAMHLWSQSDDFNEKENVPGQLALGFEERR